MAVFPADDALRAAVARAAPARGRMLTFALDGARRRRPGRALNGTATTGRWCCRRRPAPLDAARCISPAATTCSNALAAAACALAAGVPLDAIARGLEAFEPVKGRSQRRRVAAAAAARVTLVDDTYNANPDSVRAAIDVLAELPGPRWLVLGDMGEVGDQGPAFHAEVGAYARERGIEQLWTSALGDARRARPSARRAPLRRRRRADRRAAGELRRRARACWSRARAS